MTPYEKTAIEILRAMQRSLQKIEKDINYLKEDAAKFDDAIFEIGEPSQVEIAKNFPKEKLDVLLKDLLDTKKSDTKKLGKNIIDFPKI